MSNLSLYNITNKFVELMENDELTEEQVQEIGTELAEQLTNKSANVIGYVRNVDSTIEAIKAEENRLKEMRKRGEARLEKFKEYVKACMDKLQLTKIETELGTLTIAKNPISVEIIDENLVPEEYKTVVTEVKIDKKAIGDNFKANGEIVAGTKVHADNTSLRIK